VLGQVHGSLGRAEEARGVQGVDLHAHVLQLRGRQVGQRVDRLAHVLARRQVPAPHGKWIRVIADDYTDQYDRLAHVLARGEVPAPKEDEVKNMAE
jgi:hypothetical protein